MKQFILLVILGLVLSSSSALAQGENTPHEVYCEVVGTSKFMSAKVKIEIDYGEETNGWQRFLKDEETGKNKTFNSMVDALNYMGGQGWIFVQAYVVTQNNQNVYRYLLKKAVVEE